MGSMLVQICLVLFAVAPVVHPAPTPICFEGFIMDDYCINLGVLLENTKLVTLESPDVHTYHCLLDVPRCFGSGYELLRDPPAGSKKYCRAYKLDSAGNALAIQVGRAAGKSGGCTTCTNTSAAAPTVGMRATVRGTIESTDTGSPKLLKTTSLVVGGAGCGADLTPPPPCVEATGPSGLTLVYIHGTLMMLSWGVLLPSGVFIAHFLRHRDPLWFKIHRAVQATGITLALAGFIVALSSFNVFVPGYGAIPQLHGSLGVIIMFFGLLQPVNAYFRPHKEAGHDISPARQRWEYLHKGAGYFCISASVLNIVLGTQLSLSLGMQIAYYCVLAALCVLLAGLAMNRSAARKGASSPKMPANNEVVEMQ